MSAYDQNQLVFSGIHGWLTFSVEELKSIFGTEKMDDVPESAFAADIYFEPGRIVEIRWRCYGRTPVVQKMAAVLFHLNEAAKPHVKKFEIDAG